MRTEKARRTLFLVLTALAVSCAHAGAPVPADVTVVRSVSLRGSIEGIVALRCAGGLEGQCDVQKERRKSGGSGRVELWQDARITPDIRAKLWGTSGGDIAAMKLRPARLVLRNDAGAVISVLELERPLADFDLLFDEPHGLPALLVRQDFSAGTADSGVVGSVVQVAAASSGKPAQLRFALVTGPASAPLRHPDGGVEQLSLTQRDAHVDIPSRGILVLSKSQGAAMLDETYCMHHTIEVNAARAASYAPVTWHVSYRKHGEEWRRTLAVGLEGCDF